MLPAELSMKAGMRQVTLRGTLIGLAIGSVVLFTNFQFGLQTGWVSMMSLPSALLAFAVFKTLQGKLIEEFSDVENVYVQSVAVAVGTGPLAFGLVGIVPALEKFLLPEEGGPLHFNLFQIMLWCSGLAFFGVFFAVPLRRQLILREKLKFPSGSATATMISVLHKKDVSTQFNQEAVPTTSVDENGNSRVIMPGEAVSLRESDQYSENILKMIYSFCISAAFTFFSYFFPIIRRLPFLGNRLAKEYFWTFEPSPAYMGQGVIMGLPTVSSMLFGAILGWAILAPLAQKKGWAPGPIDDWKTGGQGWILWISLAIMIVDSVISFLVLAGTTLVRFFNRRKAGYRILPSIHEDATDDDVSDLNEPAPDAPVTELVSQKVMIIGASLAVLLCVLSMSIVFHSKVPLYSIFWALLFAIALSVLAVRALGETDLNPVSGIGKVSQLLFALIVPRDHPSAIIINMVAGGIAEAGAQQAGDLMQDLKTGHMIGSSPKAQFYAQLIGSAWSIVLSSLTYRLYNIVYDIPNSVFRIPTAVVWIDCARLVTGNDLPSHAGMASLIFGIIFGVLSLIKNIFRDRSWSVYIPSGVAVGVGLYNTPSFTIARFLGGLVAYIYQHRYKNSNLFLIICASGLILGEGLFSIINLIMTGIGVPHF